MPRTLRASRQAIKPMSVADAARAVDGNRDGIVVFRDPETAAISVLYRRHDGELTLVEIEHSHRRQTVMTTTDAERPTTTSMSPVPGVTVGALLRSRPETFGLPLELLAGADGLDRASSPARTSRKPASRWPASTSTSKPAAC